MEVEGERPPRQETEMLALATELVLETRVESPSVKPGPFEWVLSERSLPSGLVERVVLTETEA